MIGRADSCEACLTVYACRRCDTLTPLKNLHDSSRECDRCVKEQHIAERKASAPALMPTIDKRKKTSQKGKLTAQARSKRRRQEAQPRKSTADSAQVLTNGGNKIGRGEEQREKKRRQRKKQEKLKRERETQEKVSSQERKEKARGTRISTAAAAAAKTEMKPNKQRKVVVTGAQRETKQYTGTSEQRQSQIWKDEGTEALRDDPLDWQIPYATFAGVNTPLTAGERACVQPTGNRDSWFNDAVMAAYAHLIQRAHMEEQPAAGRSPVQIIPPAVTLSQIIREGQRTKLVKQTAKVGSATRQVKKGQP